MATTLTSTGVLYNDGTTITNSVTATRAIFGFGGVPTSVTSNITNLVNNYGGVATDTSGVGTARHSLAAAGYGGDKAIFAFGLVGFAPPSYSNLYNHISNLGVIVNDASSLLNGRGLLAAASYGGDKAIFGYGRSSTSVLSETNLVSNTGLIVDDTIGVGTARDGLAAAGYGGDKAIFGYGAPVTAVSITNLVSNTGVVSTDTTGVGTARFNLAAAGYGGDKAIFGYGDTGSVRLSITNLVSNLGVVATDTTGVGTARVTLAAAGYGGDKALFGYGSTGAGGFSPVNVTNKVSNLGVVATDTTGVGTARSYIAAASYSS